jgi:hypothetical protein
LRPTDVLDVRGIAVRFRAGARSFSVPQRFRTCLQPTKSAIQLVQGIIPRVLNWPLREAENWAHQLPRLKMSGAITPLPFMLSWRVQTQLHVYFYDCNFIALIWVSCLHQICMEPVESTVLRSFFLSLSLSLSLSLQSKWIHHNRKNTEVQKINTMELIGLRDTMLSTADITYLLKALND